VVSSLTTWRFDFCGVDRNNVSASRLLGKQSPAGVFDSCDATFANWSGFDSENKRSDLFFTVVV